MNRPDEILRDAAQLFAERNAAYGDNFLMVSRVLTAMFPNGVRLAPEDYGLWHNFELMIVKLCRFAQSGLTHDDSIRDLIVYSAIAKHQMTGRPIGSDDAE